MDRNSIIGFILIIGIVITYGIITKPSAEELKTLQQQRDSIMLVEMEQQKMDAENKFKIENQQESQKTLALASGDSSINKVLEDRYGLFAPFAQGKTEFITLENDLIKINVSTQGGRPYAVNLKEYKTSDSNQLVLFDGDSTIFGFNFFAQNRSISTNQLYFTPKFKTTALKAINDSVVLSMKMEITAESYIEYVYTLKPNSYMVDFKVNMVNMEKIISSKMNSLDFQWEAYAPQMEKSASTENTFTTIAYKYIAEDVEQMSPTSKKDQTEELTTKVRWVAFKHQFFSTVLISEDAFLDANLNMITMPEGEKYLKKFNARISVPYNSTVAANSIPMKIYFGPNHYNTLKSQGYELEGIISLGWTIIKWINKGLIIPIFNFLNNYIGNYGIIILLLTLLIKTILFPLTFKSYMSTAKMRALKPQVDEINKKIPKEKTMERQQASMALYKKVGVNPLGGCLPMLLQMPILIAMYKFFPSSIELRQEGFLWATDLSSYDSIINLPFTIPAYGAHVSLFTLLMTATTLLSMRMNTQPGSFDQPGMKVMMYIMPVVFMFMFNSFSSGLTYYLFLANVITIGQNALFNWFIDENKLLQKLNEKKKKPVKKSGFQARLEEMAKKRGVQLPK